jgi:hypothetical protein
VLGALIIASLDNGMSSDVRTGPVRGQGGVLVAAIGFDKFGRRRRNDNYSGHKKGSKRTRQIVRQSAQILFFAPLCLSRLYV